MECGDILLVPLCDQPALLNADLTEQDAGTPAGSGRENPSSLEDGSVVSADRLSMGELAEIEPALIVTPPLGWRQVMCDA
jgi:hypothetical protein